MDSNVVPVPAAEPREPATGRLPARMLIAWMGPADAVAPLAAGAVPDQLLHDRVARAWQAVAARGPVGTEIEAVVDDHKALEPVAARLRADPSRQATFAEGWEVGSISPACLPTSRSF